MFAIGAFGFLAAAGSAAAAQETPQQPTDCGVYEGVVCQGWFTDAANVVADDQEIEDAIDRLVGRYGNQIALIVVDDSRGQDPRDFAVGIGDSWGVGSPDTEDGIVILVDLDARRTELVTQSRISLPAERITGAGNSFFGVGKWDAGLIAIVGSLEQALEDEAGGGGVVAPPPTSGQTGSPPPVSTEDESSGVFALVALGTVALVGGGLGLRAASRSRHSRVQRRRSALIDGDLEALEPAGHELPLIADYQLPFSGEAPGVSTQEALKAL